ncbi:hypothetical protein F511_25567 [Dorcoceras hygrometricum]|uniref:Uncharacterized protein n=1 Tax=Dorcoceras hygrometricum TaxID=472368 RepID=A0A2Z7CVC9_9LAMI|nr:hypothetical protein F511_25567 [Dorcoceras hygrometricum]
MRGGDDDRAPFMAHSSAPAAPISRNQCARLADNGRPASGHCAAISRDLRGASLRRVQKLRNLSRMGCCPTSQPACYDRAASARPQAGHHRAMHGACSARLSHHHARGRQQAVGLPLHNRARSNSQGSAGPAVDPPIRSTTGFNLPPSICTRRLDGFAMDRITSKNGSEQPWATTIAAPKSQFRTCPAIMVKRLATSPHDPRGITDSACKNQLVVVSVQYDPFNSYIPIRSTTIGKSRVARDLIAMHTSWRSNSDIASVTSIGYPCMKVSGESSTTKHRLLHASGPHPISPPNDPKKRDPDPNSSRKTFKNNHDSKVLDAEESNHKWTNSNSEQSTSSSSSESEQEEVHCLMADYNDEIFDFSNVEFTQEDLVSALNEMVHEYKSLEAEISKLKTENDFSNEVR